MYDDNKKEDFSRDQKMPKVLVVESNEEILDSIRSYLETLGYECLKAADIQKALELVRSSDIDLVLTDVKLNKESGLELKRKIEEMVPAPPFVFMAEYVDWKTLEEILKEGIRDFLLFPFKMEQLKNSLERVLEEERLKEENIKLNTLIRLERFASLLLKTKSQEEALNFLKGYLIQYAGVDEVIFFNQKGEVILEKCNKREMCKAIKNFALKHFPKGINYSLLTLDELNGLVPKEELGDVHEIIVYVLKAKEKAKEKVELVCAAAKREKSFSEVEKLAFNVLLSHFSDYYLMQKYRDELEEAYLEVIEALARAVESRDPYTGTHCDSVEELADKIAAKLKLSKHEREILKRAARMHDIGKVSIPDEILLKPGKLTAEEFEIIKKHPIIGYEILSKSKGLSETAKVVLHHHEWYSGGGYPFGLKGEEIPLLSRILCLADAYHALTSDRPYRKALSPEEALKVIKEETPLKFDPKLVEILEQILQEELVVVRK
jgi:putative nucleotidyltransferase with HDIG domain